MTMTISRTDLARRTREAIENTQRGQTIFIESYGAEQAVIVDARDYHLLRAAAVYRSQPLAPVNNPEATPRGLTEMEIKTRAANAAGDIQAVWDLVIATYLDGDISLGRAAVLLDLPRFDLLARFNRLGLPTRLGALNLKEAQDEYLTLRNNSDY